MKSLFLLALLFAFAFAVDVKLSFSTPLKVDFTLVNPTDAPVKVLHWGTPLEGIRSNMFDIRDDKDNRLEYTGMLVRRGPTPLPEEYTSLPAHSSLTVTVDLWSIYKFSSIGKFSISLDLPFTDNNFQVNDEIVAFELKSLPFSDITRPALRDYTNCYNNEITIIVSAVDGARSEAATAFNCLNAGSCYDLAVRWFGTYSQANYDYDMAVFNAVRNRLTNSQFNAYCNPAGCGNNVYAYVYPSDSTMTVYLCNLFWQIPNERVNTIVHEMSHFNSLGATNDYAYGKTACLNLARSNPYSASHNADSVCYFSEEA